MRIVLGLIIGVLPISLGTSFARGPASPVSNSLAASELRALYAGHYQLPSLSPLLEPVAGAFRDMAIRRLIVQLGDESFKTREAARRQLEAIGLPALNALQGATEYGDLETRSRAKLLIRTIRERNRLSTLIDGMEFKLIVDQDWWLPKYQIASDVVLQITNRSENPRRLILNSTVWCSIRDATGKSLPVIGGGTDRAAADLPPFSVPGAMRVSGLRVLLSSACRKCRGA